MTQRNLTPVCPCCWGCRCTNMDTVHGRRNRFICNTCGVEWTQIPIHLLQFGSDPGIIFENKKSCDSFGFAYSFGPTKNNGSEYAEMMSKQSQSLCDNCQMNIGKIQRGCYSCEYIEGDRLCIGCYTLLHDELQEFYPAPGNGLLPARMLMGRIAKILPKRFNRIEAITIYICMGRLIHAYELTKQTYQTVHIPIPTNRNLFQDS